MLTGRRVPRPAVVPISPTCQGKVFVLETISRASESPALPAPITQ
jgi:hypothetical protein